ncbi:MAG TPA: DUF2911 domain-containing protein [Balneolaceae bacterium]|nr:DUF2911 domain-containing protein [Balneolaceae bacterium]
MHFTGQKFWLGILVMLLFLSGCNKPQPQEPDPVRRKSPITIASVKYPPAKTYIKIVYGQPYKRGRDIFGNLVPYDQVWRTGANEATEITTTQDIIFAGKKVPAGTYALFTIPHKNGKWTIILNSKLGQWGAFEYDQKDDFLRVNVPTDKTEKPTQAFTIQFDDVKNNSTNIDLNWDFTRVQIPIEFTGKQLANP